MIAAETTKPETSWSWKQAIAARIWRYSQLFIVLLLVATLLAGFAWEYWVWDILANLRVQQIVVAVVLAIVCGFYRRWIWLAICVACMMIHLPWFLPNGHHTAGSFDYQIATFTVCNVNSANQHFDAAISDILLDEPDVFVVLEITSQWAEQIEAATADAYPHKIVRPQDRGNFGIGLYSRHPIVTSDVFRLNVDIDSIEALVQIDNKKYRVIGTHPLPPIRASGFHDRNQHLQLLAEHVRQPNDSFAGHPTIVMGDLNITPWSPIFHDFVSRSGLQSSHRTVGQPLGGSTTPTWYVVPTFMMGLSLDHILHSDDLDCLTRRVGGPIGSDHRSVTVTVGGLAEENVEEIDELR